MSNIINARLRFPRKTETSWVSQNNFNTNILNGEPICTSGLQRGSYTLDSLKIGVKNTNYDKIIPIGSLVFKNNNGTDIIATSPYIQSNTISIVEGYNGSDVSTVNIEQKKATASNFGAIKLKTDDTITVGNPIEGKAYPVQLDANGVAGVKVPSYTSSPSYSEGPGINIENNTISTKTDNVKGDAVSVGRNEIVEFSSNDNSMALLKLMHDDSGNLCMPMYNRLMAILSMPDEKWSEFCSIFGIEEFNKRK